MDMEKLNFLIERYKASHVAGGDNTVLNKKMVLALRGFFRTELKKILEKKAKKTVLEQKLAFLKEIYKK